jgi:hypothetical protein
MSSDGPRCPRCGAPKRISRMRQAAGGVLKVAGPVARVAKLGRFVPPLTGVADILSVVIGELAPAIGRTIVERGKVRCQSCPPCTRCGETGSIICEVCQGTAIIACAGCQGRGTVTRWVLLQRGCAVCNGAGTVGCTTCAGAKVVACPDC